MIKIEFKSVGVYREKTVKIFGITVFKVRRYSPEYNELMDYIRGGVPIKRVDEL